MISDKRINEILAEEDCLSMSFGPAAVRRAVNDTKYAPGLSMIRDSIDPKVDEEGIARSVCKTLKKSWPTKDQPREPWYTRKPSKKATRAIKMMITEYSDTGKLSHETYAKAMSIYMDTPEWRGHILSGAEMAEREATYHIPVVYKRFRVQGGKIQDVLHPRPYEPGTPPGETPHVFVEERTQTATCNRCGAISQFNRMDYFREDKMVMTAMSVWHCPNLLCPSRKEGNPVGFRVWDWTAPEPKQYVRYEFYGDTDSCLLWATNEFDRMLSHVGSAIARIY